MGQLRERASGIVFEVGRRALAAEAGASLDGDPDVAIELVEGSGSRCRATPCRPLPDLGAFATSVAAAIDPTVARPVVVDRVLGTITGLRPPLLAEPDVAPELDIPLWKFLSERSPDWLLPGSGTSRPTACWPSQTNPAFIDALLIGANHQTLGELRWRNLPITTRWTPLRRFWERIDVGAGEVATDIRPVVALATDQAIWTDASTSATSATCPTPPTA